jgi:putative ABC transport system ATP-binding protein
MDDRGWLRLPEPMRDQAGVAGELSISRVGDSLVLVPPIGSTRPEPVGETRAAEAAQAAALPTPRASSAADPPAMRQSADGLLGRLVGVYKSYDQLVLAGVDLDLRPGELVVVRGRSGAGKSTLLRVLIGLERPDAGQVWLGGVRLDGLDRPKLAELRRRTSAVVTQNVRLAEESDPIANLELARAVRRLPRDPELIDGWLAALGVQALAHRPVRLLSGGERQRVAVARALAVQPSLAVLDEPTSQLDESAAELLAGVLGSVAPASTVVLSPDHDPVLVAAADRVIDLEAAPR